METSAVLLSCVGAVQKEARTPRPLRLTVGGPMRLCVFVSLLYGCIEILMSVCMGLLYFWFVIVQTRQCRSI